MRKLLLSAAVASLAIVPVIAQEEAEGSVVYSSTISIDRDTWDGDWQVFANTANPESTWKPAFINDGANPGPWAKIDFLANAEDSQHDDWLVSPAVELEVGKEYIVEFQYFSAYTDTDRLSLYASAEIEPDNLVVTEPIWTKEDITEPTRYEKAALASCKFAPAESGEYHFTFFYFADGSCDGMYVGHLRIVDPEGEVVTPPDHVIPDPKEVPYSSPLTTNAVVDPDWTIINANEDIYTWHGNTLGLLINTMRESTDTGLTDDWAVSPPIVLKGGQSYTIKFDIRTGDAISKRQYPENLTLYAATELTPEALKAGTMVVELFDYSSNKETYWDPIEAEFTPETDGEYFFGFHCHSYVYMYSVYLRNFSIDETSGIAEMESAEDAPAVYYDMQGRMVTAPERGIFIRKQGSRSTKVMIR